MIQSVTSREHIKDYIKDWVNRRENPKFAVLIERKWGCGKTYFVKELIDDANLITRKARNGDIKEGIKRIYLTLWNFYIGRA